MYSDVFSYALSAMVNINIASFNTRGILNNQKRRSIIHYFKERQCDLIFLQETHSKPELENQWKSDWVHQGNIFFNHSNTQGGGVLCMLKNNLQIKENISIIPGRLQKLKFAINESTIIFYNVHTPNYDREQCIFF